MIYEEQETITPLNHEELIALALGKSKLTRLEVELILRLETYVALYGDYLQHSH